MSKSETFSEMLCYNIYKKIFTVDDTRSSNRRLVQQGAAITVEIPCRSRCRTQSTLITVASIIFTNSQTFYSGLTKHCTSHQSAAAAAMSMMLLQKLLRNLPNLLNSRISPVGLDLLHHPNKNPQQSAS